MHLTRFHAHHVIARGLQPVGQMLSQHACLETNGGDLAVKPIEDMNDIFDVRSNRRLPLEVVYRFFCKFSEAQRS